MPTFLDAGERLFQDTCDLHGLRHVRTVAAPGVVHLEFVGRCCWCRNRGYWSAASSAILESMTGE